MRNSLLFPAVLSVISLTTSLSARTFTNQSGTKIEAEFVSAKNDQVTIKMANGKVFTIEVNTLSKADRDYIIELSKPKKIKLDKRIKPGAAIKLDFPDLATDRKDSPAALNMRIPDNYDPAKPVPLIIYLGGGDGGNSSGSCASLVDQKEFLMIGLPYPKGADNPSQGNMVGDFKKIWAYHKTMLDEVTELVPNIHPDLRIIAGFSNGGHAIDGMMKEKEFKRFFKAFVLIDGGMGEGKYSGMSGTFAYIAWGTTGTNNSANAQNVAKSAKRGKMEVESHGMEGVGHAFPASEKELVKKWITETVVPGLSGSKN